MFACALYGHLYDNIVCAFVYVARAVLLRRSGLRAEPGDGTIHPHTRTHAHGHTRTHARTHARTHTHAHAHARTHAHAHAQHGEHSHSGWACPLPSPPPLSSGETSPGRAGSRGIPGGGREVWGERAHVAELPGSPILEGGVPVPAGDLNGEIDPSLPPRLPPFRSGRFWGERAAAPAAEALCDIIYKYTHTLPRSWSTPCGSWPSTAPSTYSASAYTGEPACVCV
jgi:hypothetical protein